MSKRLWGVCAALFAALTIGVPAATPSAQHAHATHMLVGLLDEAHTLYGNPDQTFPILKKLRVQVLRIDLYWGGKFGVAKSRPTDATDPTDPAYDWSAYDRTAQYANQYGIKLLLTVYGTPGWANHGKGLNHAPTNFTDLQKFAKAAATRYSGDFVGDDGRTLPAVKMWTAWNEPNEPFQLSPQYRKVGGKYIVQSAIDYAKICNAVYAGVHSADASGEKVACGVTAPGGNNAPTGIRPTVSPIAFLIAAKNAGMKKFDAYAHHPYPRKPIETPTTRPPTNAVTLANLGDLEQEVTKLYGPKPIWITEYGYQTNPPDKTAGVSWAQQASYLKLAYAKARKDPRIQVMLWFLLKDEPVLSGWQSGLETASGKKKPAYTAFMNLPH